MIPQITTPKILHGQIQMLPILKALDGINNEGIPHLIEQNLLINNGADTLLDNDPKLNKNVLGLGYLFHGIDLLCLLVLYFPHGAETTRTYLIDEVVGRAG